MRDYRKEALARLEAVRVHAKENGYTDQFIGDKLGIARNNVSRLFSGNHLPGLDTLMELCDIVKFPLENLFPKKGKK